MSSATPSHAAPPVTGDRSIIASWSDRIAHGVRATAFWTAAVLPLVVMAGLAIGAAAQYPAALIAVLTINVICAVVGHGHTPTH